MRSFVLLSLFTLLLTTTIGRPSQMDERNEREAEQSEYEANEEAQMEENAQEEDDSRFSDQDASEDDEGRIQQLVKTGRDQHRPLIPNPERGCRANPDNLSEYSRSKTKVDETVHLNDDFSSLPKRRQFNKYIENGDLNDPSGNVHFTNHKTGHIQGNARDDELARRNIDAHVSSFSDSDSLYENNRDNRNEGEKAEYNNQVVDSNEQDRHFKQYYNTLQSGHKMMLGNRYYDNTNRDRRQAERTLVLSSTSTEKEISAITNEEDEAAIKRHIRKLSGKELEELLNSLSEDKRALLNKIMDGDSTYETLIKREITKKAGAVGENSYIDSGLSEISKVQGGPTIDINTESTISPSTNMSNNIKQQESQRDAADISNTKSAETTRSENSDNKIDITRQSIIDENSNIKPDSNLNTNEGSSDSSDVQATRQENKLEINTNNNRNMDDSLNDAQAADNYVNSKDSEDSLNDQGSIYTQDDELTQLMDEEALLHNDHQYKREVPETRADLDESMRSLEESFPNSNCEESGQYFETNLAPLVRVKRKNEEVRKRSAAQLPEDKVAYFPYKAENDDEDNEEGSEFDDDGFYDRTSNYAKNIANKPADKIAVSNYVVRSSPQKLSKAQTNIGGDFKSDGPSNDKLESDTTNLGSDSDSVLSGVEGVDDNLMFNSGVRNRRTLESDAEETPEVEQFKPMHSTPEAITEGKPLPNYINLPNYQETDAFGPLPRNDGELNRYKRIRRVKSSPSSDVAGK